MEEDQSKTIVKRWVGYVCPECHVIFRMEVGNGGRRAQCPGCEALVVLGGKLVADPVREEPGEGDEPEVEGESQEVEGHPQEAGPGEEAELESGPGLGDAEGRSGDSDGEGVTRERRKKVRKKKGVPKAPSWEQEVRKTKKTRMGWVLPTFCVLTLMAMGAGVAYWARSIAGWGGEGGGSVRGGGIEDPGLPETGIDADVGVDDLAPVVEQFLEAETVDGLLATVRDRDRLEPEIRRFYADGFRPVEVRKVAPDGEFQTTGGMFAVMVEMPDFSRQPIALEKGEDGFLVDWESWVGHSGMPWDEFMRQRPTEPVLFRVRTEHLDYYNFDFSDDKTWQSFRFESPDGERTLYGYVPRYSEMVGKLKPLDPEVSTSTHIVMLRYREGASRPDQVLVEEVVASGWVKKDGEN